MANVLGGSPMTKASEIAEGTPQEVCACNAALHTEQRLDKETWRSLCCHQLSSPVALATAHVVA